MKLNKKIRFLISADGGAASGKSFGSKLIAKKYNFKMLTSGLLYRLVAYKLLSKKRIKSQNNFLKKITKNIKTKDLKNKNLYSAEVTERSYKIAKIKKVRNLLKKYQKEFAKKRLAIIEGRDIGTVIAPNADLKLFFKCSLNVKARRRYKEYLKKNKKVSFYEVKKSIKLRDLTDAKRKISPLRPAKGAIIVDNSKLNKRKLIMKLSKIVEKRIKEKYGKFK